MIYTASPRFSSHLSLPFPTHYFNKTFRRGNHFFLMTYTNVLKRNVNNQMVQVMNTSSFPAFHSRKDIIKAMKLVRSIARLRNLPKDNYCSRFKLLDKDRGLCYFCISQTTAKLQSLQLARTYTYSLRILVTTAWFPFKLLDITPRKGRVFYNDLKCFLQAYQRDRLD